MKKVVFEGTINGEKFDNVQDYNKKMSTLISTGETNIEASSSTSITEEVNRDGKKGGGSEKSEIDFNQFIPIKNDVNYELDKLIYDDKLSEEDIINSEDLTQLLSDLKNVLNEGKFDLDQILEFISVIKNIRLGIYNKLNEYVEVLARSMEDLEEKQKFIATLQERIPVIESVSEYYDDVWDSLKSYLFIN